MDAKKLSVHINFIAETHGAAKVGAATGGKERVFEVSLRAAVRR